MRTTRRNWRKMAINLCQKMMTESKSEQWILQDGAEK
jgi:hypothetical protein